MLAGSPHARNNNEGPRLASCQNCFWLAGAEVGRVAVWGYFVPSWLKEGLSVPWGLPLHLSSLNRSWGPHNSHSIGIRELGGGSQNDVSGNKDPSEQLLCAR